MKEIAKWVVKFAGWVVLGALSLYLFAGFALVPLVFPSVVKRVGAKMLSHPVSLRRAYFNPITFRLVLRDFSIGVVTLDTDNAEMLGFKKFWADVNIWKLIGKRVRVSSTGFEGLRVNAVLLPGNRINLASLLPPKASGTETAARLPDIAVREFVLRDGSVVFTDRSVGVGFSIKLEPVDVTVTGLSTRPDSKVTMKFKAIVDGKGPMTIDAAVQPFLPSPRMEGNFSMSDYAMRALTPYVGKYTGRAVKEGGRLDARASFRLADDKLDATHRLLVQDFDFGEKVKSKDALDLPFGLAVALLKDPQGRIDISLPVTGRVRDPQFNYFHVLGKASVDYFKKLVDSPFKALSILIFGGTDTGTKELGAVLFSPGASSVPEGEKNKLKALAAILRERPRISFAIHGGYDPKVDGEAMKARAFSMVRPANLKELAKARGQAVFDQLIAAGVDKARVKQGSVRVTLATMGTVPTEFNVTVYEGK